MPAAHCCRPFFLSLLLSVVNPIVVEPTPLLLKLLLVILLPLSVGKVARERSAPVLDFVKKRKTYLSSARVPQRCRFMLCTGQRLVGLCRLHELCSTPQADGEHTGYIGYIGYIDYIRRRVRHLELPLCSPRVRLHPMWQTRRTSR